MTMNSFSPAPIAVSSSKNSSNSNNSNTSTTLSRLLPATARRFMRGLSSGNIMASSTSSSSLSDHRRGDTEFFASLETNTDLAFFHRREVEAGHLLGQGTFTSIRAVNAIQLVVAPEGACDDSTASLAHDKQQKRLEIQATVQSPQQGQQQQQQPRYAIKQLTVETVEEADPKTRAKAARELVNDAKFLARLAGHDNIVTLRGMTLDAFGRNYLPSRYHDFFILLDCLSETTLADRIYQTWRADPHRGGDPDEDLIPMKANYAFQIAKALKYCHLHGVLYRNLQPTNVGFSTRDPHTIQLLDFGLARDFPPLKATTTNNNSHHRNHAILYGEQEATYRLTLAGTRRYLAGEVLTTGAYSWKSDVYSWAMTFYEMLCERKPYAGMSAADHQTYVCEQGNRPSLEDYYLPDELDEILTLSWHPRLADRWTMDEVCEHMQSFLMELDIGYYEQKEGEFLFDIEIQPSNEYDVELLHEDEDWTVGVGGTTTMGERSISTAMLLAAMEEETTAADTTNNNEGEEEQEEDLRTSLKSLESTGADDTGGNHKRATPIRQKPRKVISSAA